MNRTAVALLGLAGGVQMVDPTISSIAFVEASEDLGFSPSMAALAASVSTLALAATVIATGAVADRLGRRRVFIAALLTAAAGNVIVAVGPTTPMYMGGRIIAGIGLGAVFGSAFAFVRDVAGEEMGKALGLFAALNGAVIVVGGLAGGALAAWSWRLAFLVVPALCVLLALASRSVLPDIQPLGAGRVGHRGCAVRSQQGRSRPHQPSESLPLASP
ncbi:MAG: MFS transporter [Actinomycetia bacterium]|nr:MFS transporter [Actinomycetes bacterium]